MKMKSILILNVVFFIAASSFAQTIKGKIVESKTKEPIPQANLVLIDQNMPTSIKYAASDSAGLFELSDVPKGKYSLSVNTLGYQKLQIEILINDQQKVYELGNLFLIEDLNQLKEVTITGGAPNFATSNGQTKIGIANNAFFKTSTNLLDVFRKLPGLQVSPDGTMQMASRAIPTLFVDGKPANMNTDEIQVYLSSLTPEMVESIEIINQPSSKYDGEYQGIIDIQLKRNQSLGLKGTYNGRFQRNNYNLLENNLSLVYKASRFVYDLKFGHTNGSTFYKYNALQYLTNTNSMITDTRTVTANQNFNAQARIAYELKKGQNLEAFIRTFEIDRNAVSNNNLLTKKNTLNHTIGHIRSDNNALPRQHNYAGGLNYDAQFKNSELHVIGSFAQIDNQQTEDIQNYDILNNELQNYWKTNSSNNILIHSAQADYTQNLNIDKLEFGGKFANTSTQNNLRYDTLANDIFSLDPNRSNQFSYKESISAGYVSYIGQMNKFNYNLSLRAEYTHSIANSITLNMVTERKYLKWLPSLSVTYAISKREQINFSYSRRLTRPTFAALNPFRFYYSPRHYWIGNPYLQPSTTNLLALSYSLKTFNISLNAGRETDVMTRYPEYNATTNELVFLGRNVPYRNFANLQFSSPLNINKWWRMNHNIGLYYNKELTPYLGKNYAIPIFNYSINGSQVFALKDWALDLTYSYESKSGNGLYHFSPVYGIDFGVQKSWFQNRISTKLALQNAFDSVKRRLIFREKSIIDNDMTHYFGPQRLVFSFSYNFGSSTYKAKESKKSDEENRAN